MSKQKLRVFKVIDCDDDKYIFAATSLGNLNEEFEEEGQWGCEIKAVTEIPEEEWSKHMINMWEDNDFDTEPFQNSIEELMLGAREPFFLSMPIHLMD
jgi:hypothetical protein